MRNTVTDALRGLARQAVSGPAVEPSPGDLRDVTIAGLALPLRASIALFAVTALFVADATGTIVLDAVRGALGGAAPAMDRAIARAILFGVVPLLVVILGFRDAPGRFGRPSRYGLTLGAWRWGAGLLLAGLVIMTPVIAWLARFPEFAGYYRGAAGPLPTVLVHNLVELVPAEFVLRGFLLFTLLRRIGPLAIVVVQVPFVLAHVGKPEIELWSTFLGGSIFAWLNWRTGSILWSALGHVYVLTLMVALAGASPG